MRQPDYERGGVRLYRGDCLAILPELEAGSVDAIVTDPPYSSGGQFRGDRTQKTVEKYINSDSYNTVRIEFTGDNRDQRAYLAWCSLWSSACHAVCKPGAILACFSDWRQVPVLTDALQCGGWVWRNLATWWKPGIRMQRGRFSGSAEYVIYASYGVPTEGEESPQNVFSCNPVPSKQKVHIAEKPVAVLEWVLGLTVPGALVLDPFIGSGVTAEACIRAKRRCIGIEIDKASFEKACARVEAAFEETALLDHAAAEQLTLEAEA
jgi:site-specific DNA-methyltransferase (adenine-specific)